MTQIPNETNTTYYFMIKHLADTYNLYFGVCPAITELHLLAVKMFQSDCLFAVYFSVILDWISHPSTGVE